MEITNLINSIKDNKASGLFYYGNGTYTADVSATGAFSKIKLDPNSPKTYTDFLRKIPPLPTLAPTIP